ncbi:hypothetical protein EAI_05488 [Harpegnathos saltator]|uniref:Uncharacterized protein n=1 Tax=Harpegnathos saltator TaxID=610380 RepID=E2BC13_HARSA|nr:hypothetical protein EAI_05488 [Harpegnathos saltator]
MERHKVRGKIAMRILLRERENEGMRRGSHAYPLVEVRLEGKVSGMGSKVESLWQTGHLRDSGMLGSKR